MINFLRKTVNIVFALELIFFILVVIGILPRSTVIFIAIALALYCLFASLDNAVILFVLSIPIFLAIPITETFDNFNTWRILSLIIFLRWLTLRENRYYIWHEFSRFKHRPWQNFKDHWLFSVCIGLLLLAFLSIIPAPDKIAAVKRIIYFVNLSLIGIVAFFLIRQERGFRQKLIKAIVAPMVIVTTAGVIQLISTFFIDIYQFMRFWGEGVQLRQFGAIWSYIAVNLGNTWFAYYGEQLSLRVFSLFPDSHSFPIFLLLGLPSFFAISLLAPATKERYWSMIKTRGSLWVLFVPLIFLMMILTGTRGVWAASIGVVMWSAFVLGYMHRQKESIFHRSLFKYISSFLVIFFLCFSIAYPIFVSPQFLLSKGDLGIFRNRIRSIIDFGETSNSQRIEIWKKSLSSIIRHPLVGVGIGNFPIVLDQKIELSDAGSSAHNLYLHIAAEMGIPALILALYFIWRILTQTYKQYVNSKEPSLSLYYGALLLTIPWVFLYVLTDAALFDERAFLLFVTVAAIAFSD